MLEMQGPSLVYHAHDVGPNLYSMWKTIEGRPGYTAAELASTIFAANAAAMFTLNSSLKNVILNVHGSYAGLYIGGMQRDYTLLSDLAPFATLKGCNIGSIWLVSCKVASEEVGKKYCSKLAQLTGSTVIASEEFQTVGVLAAVDLKIGRGGRIDSFEGPVIAFYPNGSTRTSTNPHHLVNTLVFPSDSARDRVRLPRYR